MNRGKSSKQIPKSNSTSTDRTNRHERRLNSEKSDGLDAAVAAGGSSKRKRTPSASGSPSGSTKETQPTQADASPIVRRRSGHIRTSQAASSSESGGEGEVSEEDETLATGANCLADASTKLKKRSSIAVEFINFYFINIDNLMLSDTFWFTGETPET